MAFRMGLQLEMPPAGIPGAWLLRQIFRHPETPETPTTRSSRTEVIFPSSPVTVG